MGSTDLFSEKFAMYFATMNPLASKIYADIEGVEDFVKSNGPPSISYSEKCNIVDKFLIYDHLHKNDANGKLNKRLLEYQKCQLSLHKSETSLNCLVDHGDMINEAELLHPVYYNDAVIDQDHESVLLTSVAPKKPEKYVYDENNYWIDEHSAPYSGCTHTQAKACNLQQLLDSLPPPPQQAHKRHDHPLKYRAPPIPTMMGINSPAASRDHVSDNDETYIIRPPAPPDSKCKDIDRDDYDDRYSKIDKRDSEKSKTKYSVAVPLFGGAFGEAPPPQRKINTTDAGHKEEDLPNQVQNKDLIAELQAKLKHGKPTTSVITSESSFETNSRGSMKLNKPKAPPPPPPTQLKQPGGAIKMESQHQKCGVSDKSSKMPSGREISDEFLVDISSPCKIVTQKTGLDFLDNW